MAPQRVQIEIPERSFGRLQRLKVLLKQTYIALLGTSYLGPPATGTDMVAQRLVL